LGAIELKFVVKEFSQSLGSIMNIKTLVSSVAISAALLANGAAIAADPNCIAKLAELETIQQTLAQQLEVIPETLVSAEPQEKPNGLYEQLMLQIIYAQSEIVGTEKRCAKLKATSDADAVKKCEASLDDLRTAHTILTKQAQEVPKTIKTAAAKPIVNRLYEQVMLENIQLLSQISDVKADCEAQNKTATNTNSQSSLVAELRAEIKTMRGTIADLVVQNRKLTDMLERETNQNLAVNQGHK
jgi:hypothetical protein